MKILSIKEAVNQSKNYVDGRRKGLIKPLKTKFHKLNYELMGGIETNSIIVIAAMSGGGKSVLAKEIRTSISELNPDVKFKQLIFNLEMLAMKTVGRTISGQSDKALRDLYSADNPLSDKEFEELKVYYDNLSKHDIDFVEDFVTANEAIEGIYKYWFEKCKPNNYELIVEFDHLLLLNSETGQTDKSKIDEFMLKAIGLKKRIASEGGKISLIVLAQFNRDIEAVDRISNPSMHRPSKKDIMETSWIYQGADFVICPHIPAKLGLSSYTTNKYPTKYEIKGKSVNFLYLEIIKNRDGESDITIPCYNRFNRFSIDEIPLESFIKYWEVHKKGNKVIINE
jgi:replicative DNA helicase